MRNVSAADRLFRAPAGRVLVGLVHKGSFGAGRGCAKDDLVAWRDKPPNKNRWTLALASVGDQEQKEVAARLTEQKSDKVLHYDSAERLEKATDRDWEIVGQKLEPLLLFVKRFILAAVRDAKQLAKKRPSPKRVTAFRRTTPTKPTVETTAPDLDTSAVEVTETTTTTTTEATTLPVSESTKTDGSTPPTTGLADTTSIEASNQTVTTSTSISPRRAPPSWWRAMPVWAWLLVGVFGPIGLATLGFTLFLVFRQRKRPRRFLVMELGSEAAARASLEAIPDFAMPSGPKKRRPSGEAALLDDAYNSEDSFITAPKRVGDIEDSEPYEESHCMSDSPRATNNKAEDDKASLSLQNPPDNKRFLRFSGANLTSFRCPSCDSSIAKKFDDRAIFRQSSLKWDTDYWRKLHS